MENSESTESKMMQILDKYIEHPKFKDYLRRVFEDTIINGEAKVSPEELDKLLKEIEDESKEDLKN